MMNYEKLMVKCQSKSKTASAAIDDYLVNYAVDNLNLQKLVNHSRVKEHLNQEEFDFFKHQLVHPLRFSFSKIINNPKEPHIIEFITWNA